MVIYIIRREPLNSQIARELSEQKHLVILSGHYEVDQRVRDHLVDREINIGDYVLTNGTWQQPYSLTASVVLFRAFR